MVIMWHFIKPSPSLYLFRIQSSNRFQYFSKGNSKIILGFQLNYLERLGQRCQSGIIVL